MRITRKIIFFLFFLLLFSFTRLSFASVSILMQLEQVEGDSSKKYVQPGEYFTLLFKLVGANYESVCAISTDILFDKDILSISTDTDVQIAEAIADKKDIHKNLIDGNKLRVLIIGFNTNSIPNGSDLFTARFKVIKKPVLLPGTPIYIHPSSSTCEGQTIATSGNDLFLVISDTSLLLSELSGKITDSATGQGISGVLVGLINKNKPEIMYQTLTDAIGAYRISNILQGTYLLFALKDGYREFIERDLYFDQGTTLTKQISLTKGQIEFGFIFPITSSQGVFYTHLSTAWVYGISAANVNFLSIEGQQLPDYGVGDLLWSDRIALDARENLITALVGDGSGNTFDSDSIIIYRTAESDFKINIPTENEYFETTEESILVGGLTAPHAMSIELNGVAISDYQPGNSTWATTVLLSPGLNELHFCSKKGDGSAIGVDFITIKYDPSGQDEQFTITDPTSSDYYKTGQSTITIRGNTPTATDSITKNGIPISNYIPGSVSWSSSSGSLIEGANNEFFFKAFDATGKELGQDSITIEYEPGYWEEETFKIAIPTEESTYSAQQQTITIGGNTPANSKEIRLNGESISNYQLGSTSWSDSYILQSGQNYIVAAAYDTSGLEIGTDSITISFVLNFGGMNITQPVEAFEYITKKKSVHIGGQTPPNTYEIMVNEQLVPDYIAGNSIWHYDADISLGSQRFVFTAYDSNKEIIGIDEITIINPGVLQITKPTINEDITVYDKKILLGGTVSWAPDDPLTALIKINGKALVDYVEGDPLWSHEREVDLGDNDFYVLAYESSGTVPIGFDFIKVKYRILEDDPQDQTVFKITNPVQDLIITQEDSQNIEGDTPLVTEKIYRNDSEITFTCNTITWSDSVSLDLGENTLHYEANDSSEQIIGQDELLVIYTGVIKIIAPVSDALLYCTKDDTICIVLEIDAAGDILSVNDYAMIEYRGESRFEYTTDLEDGDNMFIFKLFDNNETQTGYAKINIRKTKNNKLDIGLGLCFIESLFP